MSNLILLGLYMFTILVFTPQYGVAMDPVKAKPSTVLTRFSEPEETSKWVAVNDRVMGGVSSSRFKITEDAIGVFEGLLSLENNGGFASVRTFPTVSDLSHHKGILVRVRGDGRTYRLRLRTNKNFDGIAYQAEFETVQDEWQEIELPFESFTATYRGRRMLDADPLNTANVEQMGIMLADKTPGRFRLEVAWIATYEDKRR
jgi:monofunctional biosynthetic peptidoglycan transglycosylase